MKHANNLRHLKKDEVDEFIDEKMEEILEEKAGGEKDSEEKQK